MDHHIDAQGRLVIEATPAERAALIEQMADDRFDSDAVMCEVFEPLVANSAFQWLDPSITGDLTSAPMLAELGDDQPGPDENQPGSGLEHVGCWEHEGRLRQMYRPVLRRYAFMSYQVISPQRALAETGRCVFEGGPVSVEENR